MFREIFSAKWNYQDGVLSPDVVLVYTGCPGGGGVPNTRKADLQYFAIKKCRVFRVHRKELDDKKNDTKIIYFFGVIMMVISVKTSHSQNPHLSHRSPGLCSGPHALSPRFLGHPV